MKLCLGDLPQARPAEPPPGDWHEIRSPKRRSAYLLAALLGLLIPSLLCAWLSILSFLAVGPDGAVTAQVPLPWSAVLALVVFIPAHELLHAVLHPGYGLNSQTTLVIWPAKLRFGVYYDGCMTRRRWLLMRTTPIAVLTILPAFLLGLFNYVPAPFSVHIFLQALMLVNGIGSGGDLVAATVVAVQVPRPARICFHDGQAYWAEM